MPRKVLSSAYSKDLKPVRLTLKKLDQLAEQERQELERSRAKSQPSKAQVQMSIRMEEGAYLRFKALCKSQRKTNGEMVEYLIKRFLQGE